MAEMDFPAAPSVGQQYTNSYGVLYTWNGTAWEVGFFDSATRTFTVLADLLAQIRVLLQDTDTSGGEYRYSSESIVANINMGLIEMYRMRPDIFLELGFVIPAYSEAELNGLVAIELQFVPSLIYYAVGMTQLRDDETEQDQRANLFLAKFSSTLASVA